MTENATAVVPRPDGCEKWTAHTSLPVDIARDPDLVNDIFDAMVKATAADQGVELVHRIGRTMAPCRWREEDGQLYRVPCPDDEADHYLAMERWWARPPAGDAAAVAL